MTEADQIFVRLVGDGSSYQKMLTEADRATNKFAQTTTGAMHQVEMMTGRVGGFTSMLMNYGMQMVGLGSMIGAAFSGIRLAAQMEQLQISFTVLTGSAGLAKKTLAELTQFAKETPFQMPEVVSAAKQMLAFGGTAADIVPTMKMLGDVSAALNIPLGSLTYLFGTLKAQGRAMTVDINQFAMRGIPIWKELEKQLGRSNQQVRKMVENGEIGFAQIELAFKSMTAAGGAFHDMMGKQAQSIEGLFSTLKDSVEMTLRTLGEEIIKFTGLAEKMKLAISGMDKVGEGMKEAPEGLKTTLSWVALIIGGVGALSLAWKVLSKTTMWIYGPIIGGLVKLWKSVFAVKTVVETVGATWLSAGTTAGTTTATLTTMSGGFLAVAATAAIFVGKMALVAAAIYAVYKAVVEYRRVANPRDDEAFMAQAARFAKGDELTKNMLDKEKERREKGVGAVKEDKALGIKAREADPTGSIADAMNPKHGRPRNIEMAREGRDLALENIQGLQNSAKDAKKRLDEVDTFWNRNISGEGGSIIEAAKHEYEEAQKRLERGHESVYEWRTAIDKLAFQKAVTEKEIGEFVDGLKLEIADFGMTDQDKTMRKLFGQGNAPAKEAEARADIERLRVKKVDKDAGENNKALMKQAQTFGMTAREVKLYEMAQEGASASVIKTTDALMRLNELAAQNKAIKDMTKGLQFEGLEHQMGFADKSRYLKGDFSEGPGSGHLKRLFEREKMKKTEGYTDAQLEKYDAEDKRLTALEARNKALEDGKRITEQYLSPTKKLSIEKEKLDNLFRRETISAEDYTKAMVDAKESILGTINAASRMDAVKFGSGEALDMQQDYAIRMSMQRVAAPSNYGKDKDIIPEAADIEGKKPVQLLSDMNGHLEVIAGAQKALDPSKFLMVNPGMGLP